MEETTGTTIDNHEIGAIFASTLGSTGRAYFSGTFPTSPEEGATAKDRFSARFPHVNTDYFDALTKSLLDRAYPKKCPKCGVKLTVEVGGRENAVRCPSCHYQGSRTSYTPLHHSKLPLWVFGYVLVEAIQSYPQVLSSAGIIRRLGVSNNTALLLKRRLQLFLAELVPCIKGLMVEDVEKAFGAEVLPEDPHADVSEQVKGKPVVQMDTVALFSASQRANGGRKRHKHTGQTASIYLTDQVAKEKGKYQIGTLCHTMAIKQGAVILDSVRDQTQKSLKELIDFLPKKAPIFTDDGYPWLKRYDRNHRAVNHSARAKDEKCNVWARDRWSKGGVHNQVAEGFQRTLKHAFISGYSYINPENSQLYLDEYSALKGLKVYGLDRLLGSGEGSLWASSTINEKGNGNHRGTEKGWVTARPETGRRGRAGADTEVFHRPLQSKSRSQRKPSPAGD